MHHDDNIRLYAPILRRIIVLVAVIVAVPVVLWTITAFMRSYVAPPRLPSFRSIAAVTAPTAPPAPSADSTAKEDPSADAPDAENQGVSFALPVQPTDPPSASTEDRIASSSGPAQTDNGDWPTGTATMAAAAPNNQSAETTASVPIQINVQASPSLDESSTDALPDADPITGPIPLPHPRPKVLAMAEHAIPIPRPRPTPAEGTAPATTESPLSWIGNIFRQGQQ